MQEEKQPQSSQTEEKVSKKLPTHLPIPDDHSIFTGANIFILYADITLAQRYPQQCDHDWRPDGETLDTDTLFIEDIDCIPVICEKCGVGGNLPHNRTLTNGKVI